MENSEVKIRKALAGDSGEILRWRNDPETIKFSIVKQETRLADGLGVYDDLSFSEIKSLIDSVTVSSNCSL